MFVNVAVPPAVEPVSLEEAKGHLRVDGSDDDVQIAGFITAAREWAEEFQDRAYVTQTLELVLDAWPHPDAPDYPVIKLPRSPLQSVASITYKSEDGQEHTLPASSYVFDAKSRPARVAPASRQSWPSDPLYPLGAITIRYTAGYGDTSAVPQKVKQAMLLLIGHWYEHREEVNVGNIVTQMPAGAEALLLQNKVY
jgi:uncharacterized phiE125 gp8 family phage protein